MQYRFLNGTYRTFFSPLHFEWFSRSLLLAFSFLRGAGSDFEDPLVSSWLPAQGGEYQNTQSHRSWASSHKTVSGPFTYVLVCVPWMTFSLYHSEKILILSLSLSGTIHHKTQTKWGNKQQLVACKRLCKLGILYSYSCNDTQHSSQDAFPSVSVIWNFLFLFLFSFLPPDTDS